MGQLKSLRTIVMFVFVVLYWVAFPLYFRNSNYHLGVVITASILSCISLGVWLTFSIGRINIGQGAFAAIGGYTTAILTMQLGTSFWLCLPLSGIVAAFVGLLIGIPILRLKGVYFAMITLCMTEAVTLVFLNAEKLTQGASGIMNIPRPGALTIGGVTIIPAYQAGHYLYFYYLAASLLLIVLVGLWRLNASRIGWIFRALRQSDTLALSIGINVVKYRLIAYGTCCFIGGIGGSLFTVSMQNIFPTSFRVTDSMYFMLYCFLGGLDYLLGPVVGAFLLTGSFEALRVVQKYQEGIYACLMIALMLWLPNGILSLRFRKRASGNDMKSEGY